MSLPRMQVMPADQVVSPFTIPGTTRTYSASAGTSINVPGEDGLILVAHGWCGLTLEGAFAGAGTTAQRPTSASFPTLRKDMFYVDTTLGYVVIYSGPVLNEWFHAATGASV